MSDRQDDRFKLRPSAPRSKHSTQSSFVARVLNVAYKAGPVAGAVGVAKRSRPGPRHGRGRVAASFAGQSFGIRSRRVTIKVRHVQIRGNVRVTASHIRYLEREGVGADREPGRAYGRDTDQVDCKAFGEAKRRRPSPVPHDCVRRGRGRVGRPEELHAVSDAADGEGPADPARLDRGGSLGHRTPAYSRRGPRQGSERG